MTPSLPQCPRCKVPLGESLFNQVDLRPCPQCAAPLQIEIFPALFRPIAAGRAGEALVVADEASCFFHSQKKAVVTCQGCGRFLCALCDCELRGEHFCPTCLETGKKKGKIKRLENERVLYDSVALALATLPLLLFYFSIVTAPIALFIALRYWNAPRSIVHRTKIRLVIAITFASIEILAWVIGILYFTTRSKLHG